MDSSLVVGPFSEAVLLGAAVTVVASGFALYMLYTGAKHLDRALDIFTHDPVDAGRVHLESGVVEVQGTAEPVDGTLDARYTGTDALAYSYEEKEKRRRTDSDGNTRTEWKTIDSGEVSTSFYVSDDSGRVAVDPADASLSLDSTCVDRIGRTRRYEGYLEPGETVHVYGQKQDSSDAGAHPGEESLYIGGGGVDATFTVSDTTENWTILRYTVKGVGTVLVSILLFAVATVPALQLNEELPTVGELVSTYLPMAGL